MNRATASSSDVFIRMRLSPRLSVVETPLFKFARKGQEDALLKLLSEGQDINESNKYGDTVLITATRSGHGGLMRTLIQRGADITNRNNEGDDVFRVAINHKDISVLEVLASSIQNDNKDTEWCDKIHPLLRTALHDAAKQGLCEKISVLVSVDINLDLRDENGDTFLHTAAAHNQPEVIKEFSTRFDVNVQNKQGDSPLHVACQRVTHEAILTLLEERANPGIENEVGDRSLHCLTNALNNVPGRPEKHEEVIISLLEKCIVWWSLERDIAVPNDEEAYIKWKVKGFDFLREEMINEANESVFTLAFKNGCVPVIKTLFSMHNASCFNLPDRRITQYIVTDLAPKVQKTARKSQLELLLENNSEETIEEVLNLEPVQKFEFVYNTMTSIIYFILIFIHALYMSVFSYCGTEIMENLRTNVTQESNAVAVVFYCTTPLQPVCFMLMLVYKFHCSGMKWTYSPSTYLSLGSFLIQCFSIIHHVIYSLLTIAMIYQYYIGDMYNMRNTLSVTLLIGWLTTLSLTQGLKPFRFFWRMTLKMIVVDIYKMLFVYLFILLGFTFALHVQFQVSEPVIGTYPHPMSTMFLLFRLMLGMETLFDSEFLVRIDAAGGSVSLPIVLYVLYLVLATIVLLNLLIAMMNTSYSDILTNTKTNRRVESLQRAFKLPKITSFLERVLSANVVRWGSVKGKCLVDGGDQSEPMHWFIEIRHPRSVKNQASTLLEENQTQQMLLQESDDIRDQLAHLHSKLDSIENMLQNLQANA